MEDQGKRSNRLDFGIILIVNLVVATLGSLILEHKSAKAILEGLPQYVLIFVSIFAWFKFGEGRRSKLYGPLAIVSHLAIFAIGYRETIKFGSGLVWFLETMGLLVMVGCYVLGRTLGRRELARRSG